MISDGQIWDSPLMNIPLPPLINYTQKVFNHPLHTIPKHMTDKWKDLLLCFFCFSYCTGIQLNRFYVHQSGSATRAALLTGKYAHEIGLQNGIHTGSAAHIPLDIQTLPELLKSERGYSTHLVGKWNLGYSKWSYTPTERGFDSFLGFHQKCVDYFLYTASAYIENTRYLGYDLWRDKDVHQDGRYTYATDLFTEELTSIIDDHLSSDTADQPMFVLYAPPNAHAPISYHHSYTDQCSYDDSQLIRYEYCNLVQELEQSVMTLESKLREEGLWERSLIFFTSDNGGLSCYNVGSSSSCSGAINSPLRAGKNTLFDGALRVRSFFSGGYLPENTKGMQVNSLVTAVDIFATIAHFANALGSAETVSDNAVDWFNIFTNSNATLADVESDESKVAIVGDPNVDVFGRKSAIITELQSDVTGQYIYQSVVFYHGYKYIVCPLADYDGWFSTPTNFDSIPDTGKGVVIPAVPLSPPVITGVSGQSNSVGSFANGTNKLNFALVNNIQEYLFLIHTDPYEHENLVLSMDGTIVEVLTHMRKFLAGEISSKRYSIPQVDRMCIEADPTIHDNVWYPFEDD